MPSLKPVTMETGRCAPHLLLLLMILITIHACVSASSGMHVVLAHPDLETVRITCTVDAGPQGMLHDIIINTPLPSTCVVFSPLQQECTELAARCYQSRPTVCAPTSGLDTSVTLVLHTPSEALANIETKGWRCEYGEQSEEFDIENPQVPMLTTVIVGLIVVGVSVCIFGCCFKFLKNIMPNIQGPQQTNMAHQPSPNMPYPQQQYLPYPQAIHTTYPPAVTHPNPQPGNTANPQLTCTAYTQRTDIAGRHTEEASTSSAVTDGFQQQPGVIHVFDIAKSFVDKLKLPDACFNVKRDVCFCVICHAGRGDKLVYTRGSPPATYGLPLGWCKFGLKTKPQARGYGVFDNWHVAFHGTRVESLDKILETGDLLLPGDKTPEGFVLPIPKNHWNPNHPDPKMRPPPGHDVQKFYFSPSIRYSGCEVYAPKQKWIDPKTKEEHQIRVAFQVRIRPGVYDVGKETIGAKRIIDPLFRNDELEWSTDRRGVAILVGLLVKIEDMVGNPELSKADVEETPALQADFGSPGNYTAEFKRDYTHETNKGREIELKAGDRCLVINEKGKTCSVLHNNVNEPIQVMAHYLRKL